jgi:hypothetical protein
LGGVQQGLQPLTVLRVVVETLFYALTTGQAIQTGIEYFVELFVYRELIQMRDA